MTIRSSGRLAISEPALVVVAIDEVVTSSVDMVSVPSVSL
jgi:hypothetical protein